MLNMFDKLSDRVFSCSSHVRYHVRYLTQKRQPENEIIKIQKIHFTYLKVKFDVWIDTQCISNFLFELKMDIQASK